MHDLDWTRYDVLVVDDEPDNLDAFRFAFRKSFRLHYAGSGREALDRFDRLAPAVVVADQRMPGMSGVELLRACKQRSPDCFAILLTAYTDMEVLIDALNSGAVDRYVQKPWDSKELAVIVRQGIQSHVTLADNRRMRDQLSQYAVYLEQQQRDPIDFGQVVGGGASTQRVLAQVAEVAATASPVVIEGEAGLEKDVVARALHVGSAREGKPFVQVTCAAFRGDALERELFGWCRGAFDGALTERAGRFELADGGTLYLHEPARLSASLQARLMQSLSEGRVERVGDTVARGVDVRLIVSVTPSLHEAFTDPPLLDELRSRLSVFPIRLVPLSARPEDIAPMAESFLRKYAQRNARAARSISADALARLEEYPWPGNVRELENVVERAAILARGDEVQPAHLLFNEALSPTPPPAPRAPSRDGLTLNKRLDAIERRELLRALEEHGGNKAEVARALGIQRTTLYYRLKKLGIEA